MRRPSLPRPPEPVAALAAGLTVAAALLAAPLPGAPVVAATAAAQTPEDPAAGRRTAPRPVEPPAAFRSALESDTRAPDGRPGPEYWQQEASYRIEAELDPGTGRLEGHETITYRNRSPDTLELVVLRLEQNVYAEGARRNRRAPVTGGVTVENVRVDDRSARTRHAGSGYYRALTLLEVELPEPLPPGGTRRVSLEWSFTVPPAPTFRNGNLGGEVFGVAQWYPRMAVYDDVYGWDRTPYLGDGEFYLEYGDFDVRITVPAGWVVGATGTLENAEEVLPAAGARRLDRALASDTAVRVIPAGDARRGRTTRTDAGDHLTWHFTASDVRDFAFAASADYAWDARGVDVPAAPGGGPEDPGTGPEPDEAAGPDRQRVLAQALYRPELGTWRERGLEFVAHTLRTLSTWIGPYPYPQLAIAEGPTGGMEYPMFIFNPSTDDARGLASVTIHEAAHQWFPMVVGTMEAKHAWMDEGVVSYWSELSGARLRDREPPRWGETRSYLGVAGTEREVPIMRHTDLVSPYGARGTAAYTKPAVVLGALRAVVGDETFLEAFRDFYRSWRYRHPQPWDFFNTVERHHGADLDWFWRPWFFETDVLDQAVVAVEPGETGTTVVLEDRGEAAMPTPLRLVMDDGTERERWISHAVWLEGGRHHRLTVPGRVVEVEIDPERLFPDVDRSNNRLRGGDGAPRR